MLSGQVWCSTDKAAAWFFQPVIVKQCFLADAHRAHAVKVLAHGSEHLSQASDLRQNRQMHSPVISSSAPAPTRHGLVIRPAGNGDGPALARLIAACFAEHEGCLYEASEFPELVAPASHYAARGADFHILLAESALVGSVAITPVPEQSACEITKFYLEAAHRGSGAALALMQEATQSAMRMGLADLVLWTDMRFTRAHHFYEKHGFVRQPVIRRLADVSHSWEYRYHRRGAALDTRGAAWP